MRPLARYWTTTGIATALFLVAAMPILLSADMGQGFLPVFVAFLFVLSAGLMVYSQLMIRCPHCSNRITALVDTRDGKPCGSGVPLQHCRFCGCSL